jgi:hypothetical protein
MDGIGAMDKDNEEAETSVECGWMSCDIQYPTSSFSFPVYRESPSSLALMLSNMRLDRKSTTVKNEETDLGESECIA